MDMQPVRLGSKTIFSQSVLKFGLGDRKKCRRKELEGPNPIFYQDPPKFGFVDGENGKKCMKRKGNNVGSCPFLPVTRQNTDLGMGKCEKHLSEKSEKQIFVFTSF